MLHLTTNSPTQGTAAAQSCTNMHQAGLNPEMDSSLELAKRIHDSDFAEYLGVYVHAAHSYAAKTVEGMREVAA